MNAETKTIALSVICPFFNEALILDKALEGLIHALHKGNAEWELLLVNDGSQDASLSIAEAWKQKEPRLRVLSYPVNQGRGHALQTGIQAAKGDILVTTEADLSWGEDIVGQLYQTLQDHPEMDFVIASPHLSPGGYKNVPQKRVWLSGFGNVFLRLFFSNRFTMHTGMTRAYRREVIQPFHFREKGKEFHLEVLLKLTALDFKGMEIPATLEWKEHRLQKSAKPEKRSSSSKIPQLITTHLHFAVLANPIRYFWGIAVLSFLLGGALILAGLFRFAFGQVAIYLLLMGTLLFIFGMIFFGFGTVHAQNRAILEEFWLLQHKREK